MKKQCSAWLSVIVAVLAVLNILVFYAMHSMWSGIIAILGSASPYIIMGIIVAVASGSVAMILLKRRNIVFTIIFAVLSVFFLAVEIYIFTQTQDSYMYFIREFAIALLFVGGLAAAIFFIFYYPKSALSKSIVFKLAIAAAAVLFVIFGVFGLLPNDFTCAPVVYAVGDEYQIVFTTRVNSTGWVEIGGVEYNDTYAGSRISEQRVHKICVPMQALDEAGGYTVFTRAMYLRGPYSALQGRVKSQTRDWKPVNASDGLDYYVVTDTHTKWRAASSAASYFGDKLDFLVCIGDAASWVDYPAHLAPMFKLFGAVTNGEIPVVYARGNHETKGLIADELYRYVASENEKFYYTFRLGEVWGVVLDIGEDHGDDWSEFYDSSRFTAYRQEQTAFLDAVIADKENEYAADGVKYRMAICHIPVAFKYRNDHCDAIKDEWISRLNQMQLTLMLSGHRHQMMYVDPEWDAGTLLTYDEGYCGYKPDKNDGVATAAEFPAFIITRQSDVQEITTEVNAYGKYYFGAAISSDGSKTQVLFTNEKGEALENIRSPWFDVSYGGSITVPNK